MELISIHTSDRLLFKRCRRKWGWQSRLRLNLIPRAARPNENLWFGSGWHFAMEDYHGYHRFPKMSEALEAYVKAHPEQQRPYNWDDLLEMGRGMTDYYTRYWYPRHSEFQTLWIDGVPQLEIDFELKIPGMDIPFGGTFDGMLVDAYGRWWIKEIKTAKKFDIGKLDTDPQITAYCLAAAQHYQHEISGVVYIQFRKAVPKPPTLLKDGENFSTDLAKLHTTYDTYRRAVMDRFNGIPSRYEEVLAKLLDQETWEGNNFIRVDQVERNQHQIEMEYPKLVAECKDMTNPDLFLYPNPTWLCASDCDFKAACLAYDDGSDYEGILEDEFMPRKDDVSWRERLHFPE